jgi:hypothetical protein
MAIRKQNRTIWVLAAVVFLVLVTYLIRDGKFADLSEEPVANIGANDSSTSNEEQYGDKVNSTGVPLQGESQRKYRETLERLSQCLQLKAADEPEVASVQIETLFQKLQLDWGAVQQQEDRWMTWHLKTLDGKERRLRLEITENDEGKVGRELHYFSVDREGQPTPIEIEPEKTANPTDEVISQMLKEGEVFYKDRAAVAFFANNERVEYVEKDGELAEIDVFQNDHEFRCENVKAPELCQCH